MLTTNDLTKTNDEPAKDMILNSSQKDPNNASNKDVDISIDSKQSVTTNTSIGIDSIHRDRNWSQQSSARKASAPPIKQNLVFTIPPRKEVDIPPRPPKCPVSSGNCLKPQKLN